MISVTMYSGKSHIRSGRFYLPMVLMALLFLSCDRNRLFEENIVLENQQWPSSQRLTFQCEIPSETTGYNVYLHVRNTPEYPFSNLYLFLTTTFPDGTHSKDTIELTLAGSDGRWLGSGLGSVRFSRFLFKKDVRFPLPGHYRFEFEQAMRTPLLAGISDMGMRIEKP